MKQQSTLYFPAIDGLRLLAFLFVFFRHFKTVIPSWFIYQVGWIGVELFFLISAFLLTRLLKEEYEQQGRIQTRQYFARRILRIWPLYFFYLAAISVYAGTIQSRYFSETRLLGNIFFYDNFSTALDGYNSNFCTYHLWSISMEEQYYLLLPFAVPWLLKQSRQKVIRIFLSVFAVMIIARVISVSAGRTYPFIYTLPLSGDCFLAGIILGLGVLDPILSKIKSLFAFAVTVLLLFILYFLPTDQAPGYHHVYTYALVALAFSFLLISLINKPHTILTSLFTNRTVRYLGKISFGLYIYHVAAVAWTKSLCNTLNLDPKQFHLPLALTVTVLVSIVSYEFFEKIFLRYKKRFTIIRSREP